MAPQEAKKLSLHRLLPLLLLTTYALVSVLRLSSSSPFSSYSSSSSSPRDTSDHSAVSAEVSTASDSLKTRITSTKDNHLEAHQEKADTASLLCSAFINGGMEEEMRSKSSEGGILCCDRSHNRTDVCYLRGDIRTDGPSSSILLHGAATQKGQEKIHPYTRKWETQVMNTIKEITLHPVANGSDQMMSKACDVRHDGVTGVVFSAGGYTGNMYHEFNDGLIPLYITARRFRGEVVFVVAEYEAWWLAKYRRVLEKLTHYKVIDFSSDQRIHCFSEVIVGLKIHGELTIDHKLMPNVSRQAGNGIRDFRALLHQALSPSEHKPRLQQLPPRPSPAPQPGTSDVIPRPKLVVFVRNQSRVLINLKQVVKVCRRIGFQVRILNPRRGLPLSAIYEALNSADAMLAVHGAALTHFFFMRPGGVLIQIVPLGLDWAAETYYGEPARRLGLEHLAYKVAPDESSLSNEYDRQNPVLADPTVITSKGWWETKKVYLDKQNVTVDLKRFSRVLTKAHSHIRTLLHAKA